MIKITVLLIGGPCNGQRAQVEPGARRVSVLKTKSVFDIPDFNENTTLGTEPLYCYEIHRLFHGENCGYLIGTPAGDQRGPMRIMFEEYPAPGETK